MDPFTQRITGFGVHAGDVGGVALRCMFNIAIVRMDAPRYLSSDHDPLFRYTDRRRIFEFSTFKKSRRYLTWSSPTRMWNALSAHYAESTSITPSAGTPWISKGNWPMSTLNVNQAPVHSSPVADTPAGLGGDPVTSRAELHNFCWRTQSREP